MSFGARRCMHGKVIPCQQANVRPRVMVQINFAGAKPARATQRANRVARIFTRHVQCNSGLVSPATVRPCWSDRERSLLIVLSGPAASSLGGGAGWRACSSSHVI